MNRNSRFGYLTEYSVSQMIDEIAKQSRGLYTGYERETLWHLIKRESLNEKQRIRLEHTALRLLENGVNREFWPMLRAMRVQGSKAFWVSVLDVAKRRATRIDKPLYKQGRIAAQLFIAAVMSHETNISPQALWRGRSEQYKALFRDNAVVDLTGFRHTPASI
jgi:hypothetical protein